MQHAPDPPSRPLPPLEVWCDVFPSASETFVAEEARALAALGHPVLVRAGERGDGEADPSIPVAYLWEESTAARARAMAALAARHPWRCLADLAARRRWAREEVVPPLRTLAPAIRDLARGGAIVHAHFATAPGLRALRAARILRRPWSLTAHAYDIYRSPANLAEKLRAAAVVTSGCAYTVADLQRIAGPAAAGRVHEVVMGVDLERFARTVPAPGTRHIAAVGRLVPKKGFGGLVRALAEPQLITATLTIAGDGPELQALRAQADEWDVADRVTFAGALAPGAVRALLERADVLAMPCVVAPDGDRDSMPVVVKEAMAMQLPVVVSDAVGLPELVTAACGRIVPAGDDAALARALADVLDAPPDERAGMGAAGRARVALIADLGAETARLSALLCALEPGRRRATSRRATD